MLRLSDTHAGETCTIVWLLCQAGDWLHSQLNFTEEDEIRIVENLGDGGMIVRHQEHTYALSPEIINAVRVSLS